MAAGDGATPEATVDSVEAAELARRIVGRLEDRYREHGRRLRLLGQRPDFTLTERVHASTVKRCLEDVVIEAGLCGLDVSSWVL